MLNGSQQKLVTGMGLARIVVDGACAIARGLQLLSPNEAGGSCGGDVNALSRSGDPLSTFAYVLPHWWGNYSTSQIEGQCLLHLLKTSRLRLWCVSEGPSFFGLIARMTSQH